MKPEQTRTQDKAMTQWEQFINDPQNSSIVKKINHNKMIFELRKKELQSFSTKTLHREKTLDDDFRKQLFKASELNSIKCDFVLASTNDAVWDAYRKLTKEPTNNFTVKDCM